MPPSVPSLYPGIRVVISKCTIQGRKGALLNPDSLHYETDIHLNQAGQILLEKNLKNTQM